MKHLERLIEAIKEGDDVLAKDLAKEIIVYETNLQGIIDSLSEVMRELGKQFETLEIFLPELIVAADAMMAAMDVFGPKIEEVSGATKKKGIVAMGTAHGDIHEIGKNIVCTCLKADGFEVFDLGRDVHPMDFIKKAQDINADIIGISALMTSTMPGATEVIRLLNLKEIRNQFKVIVGGAPTNDKWAHEIGADGWSDNASNAVVLCNQLMGIE